MSNLKESIKAIFQKFSVDPKAYGINLETEVALEMEAKLADGTSVFTSADSFIVGADIYTKDAEGNKVPAMAGEYQLETGEMVSVNDQGKIEEISMPEETQTEMSSEELVNAIAKLAERVSSLESTNNSLNTELTKAEDKIEELSAQLKNTKTELSSLRKQPAAPSVKEQKRVILGAEKNEKPFAQMTLRERIIKNIENIK